MVGLHVYANTHQKNNCKEESLKQLVEMGDMLTNMIPPFTPDTTACAMLDQDTVAQLCDSRSASYPSCVTPRSIDRSSTVTSGSCSGEFVVQP